MKKKDIYKLVIFVIIFAFAAYRYQTRTYTAKKSKFLLDTLIEIKLTTKEKDTEKIFESAFQLIEDYENQHSFFRNGSDLWNFNNNVIDSLLLDDDLRSILDVSAELYSKTNGHYDVTIGVLSEIWDFNNSIVPDSSKIENAIMNTGFNKLTFRDGYLTKPQNFKLNLGSLAKGFIIDKTVNYLQQQNVISGFVNAGGDIRIFGTKKPIKIGIIHPRSESNELIDLLLIGNESVVTSGDYERFFIKDGKRYHHIIDAKTGYPSHYAISVTVVGETALVADAYSTALFVLPLDKAMDLAQRNKIMAAFYYFDEDKIKRIETKEMKDYYERKN
ncbi:MAG: FAD:protein FMN transferase [Candidatus Cloacimonetes bacterium]|nr:FAD:protein FMN transferase [Candidatus Cloacimonadota bacterium]